MSPSLCSQVYRCTNGVDYPEEPLYLSEKNQPAKKINGTSQYIGHWMYSATLGMYLEHMEESEDSWKCQI